MCIRDSIKYCQRYYGCFIKRNQKVVVRLDDICLLYTSVLQTGEDIGVKHIIADIMHGALAVSYTHLDVYKRQYQFMENVFYRSQICFDMIFYGFHLFLGISL